MAKSLLLGLIFEKLDVREFEVGACRLLSKKSQLGVKN